MCNHHIIPCIAILVAKDNKMIRHWIAGIRRFEPITQLRCLAECSFREMHVINIGAFASPGSCRLLCTRGGFWWCLSVNKCNRENAKKCDGDDNDSWFHDGDV